jgi:hypothetical protein
MSQRPRVLIELGAELDRAARDGRHGASRLRDLPVPSLSGVGAFLAVGCALAVAAVAIVVLGHGNPSRETTPQHALSTPAQRDREQLRAWFPALRRAPHPADRLPPHVSAELTHQAPGSGLDLRSSRRVISTRDLQVWLMLAGRQLCEVEVNSGPRVPARSGFGDGCIGTAGAEKYGLVSSGRETFQAILPDGTSNVMITFTDGSSDVLTPNADGVILYTATRPISKYAFTSPTGAKVTQRVLYTPRPLGP